MLHQRPLIGVTADRAGHPEEQDETAYMVRRNYVDSIHRAGGMAVILPYDPANANDYIDRIDGLLVTGGRFDLPPEWYGGQPISDQSGLKTDRSMAERALVEAALAVDLPLLGICNGMQLLGVMLGAGVIEHIPADVTGALQHMAPTAPNEAQHEVYFNADCLLRTITGVVSSGVNSVHHQALLAAPSLRVAATASDGVIEAVEVRGRTFCIGLQWHPEYGVSAADTAIIDAFVTAAKARQHLAARTVA